MAMVNPVSVLSMPVSGRESKGSWLDLSALFPIARGMWTPHFSLAPLTGGKVLLHEGMVAHFIICSFTDYVYNQYT